MLKKRLLKQFNLLLFLETNNMESKIYLEMKEAKNNHPHSFENWLHDFLRFVKQTDEDPRDYLITPKSVKFWKECMSSEEGFIKAKRISDETVKYAAKSYVFIYHPSSLPKELTNMSKLALEADRVTSFFDMNFFDQSNAKNVFHGFVEGLTEAAGLIKASEYMIRFFRIYFSNFDFEEERRIGPIETWFADLHVRVSHQHVITRPNGTQIFSPTFYSSLPLEVSDKIKERMGEVGDKPTTSDYYFFYSLLSKLDLATAKNEIVLRGHDDYALLKKSGENKTYIYLFHRPSGAVINVYTDPDLGSVIRAAISLLNRN